MNADFFPEQFPADKKLKTTRRKPGRAKSPAPDGSSSPALLPAALREKLTQAIPHQPPDVITAAVIEGIRARLKAARELSIEGFGTFKVDHRQGRVGVNPHTGEIVSVPARSRILFFADGSFEQSL